MPTKPTPQTFNHSPLATLRHILINILILALYLLHDALLPKHTFSPLYFYKLGFLLVSLDPAHEMDKITTAVVLVCIDEFCSGYGFLIPNVERSNERKLNEKQKLIVAVLFWAMTVFFMNASGLRLRERVGGRVVGLFSGAERELEGRAGKKEKGSEEVEVGWKTEVYEHVLKEVEGDWSFVKSEGKRRRVRKSGKRVVFRA
ncbi:Hypothetical protein D9617_3g018450 [Elsinoe fawcettii]|nr:Hypothetical protein D9617_3g018450 [Elsinoe fawcettii]